MQPQNFEVASKSECAAASPLGHQYPIVGVLYSPNFCVVVSADVNGLICVWDAISGAQVRCPPFRLFISCRFKGSEDHP
eukprot:scaffold78404_cov32-Tisochrysis_lutea.AAC.1